ncbi:MAG: hypothetical protein A2103_00260 [Gammaproteobacteria bacterium GWF2_41_13]|nr:MAG: hypothetical protein A2103_00260 [Gammaproteobacteria bacterium GWF2_41_13]
MQNPVNLETIQFLAQAMPLFSQGRKSLAKYPCFLHRPLPSPPSSNPPVNDHGHPKTTSPLKKRS